MPPMTPPKPEDEHPEDEGMDAEEFGDILAAVLEAGPVSDAEPTGSEGGE